jgi:hypothetical protein
MSLELLKETRLPGEVAADQSDDELDEGLSGIRCPVCAWKPDASSRWCCAWIDTPEPYFESCGAVWNTFSTKGRCPGCHHQWRWTSCLRCSQWSPHGDWYENKGR